jgi:FKBP-type peptidyl-prolyl cis-trans isomerase
MKLKTTATLSLLALGLVAARAEEPKINVPSLNGAPAAAAPAAPAPSFTDAQIVEEFGWFIGKRVGLSELEFSQADIAAFIKGLSAAASGKDTPFELEKIGPQMDAFMQKKQAAFMAKAKSKSLEATAAYFAKLKETNKNVVELPSGLRYEIVKPGEGPFPKASDTVRVNYTGTLIDGTVFDATSQHQPPEPSEFPLEGVIPGWTEGIQKINKGGKLKLYVPSHLAYGDDSQGKIPPGSTLIFDVELLEIKTPAAAPAAPAPAPGVK